MSFILPRRRCGSMNAVTGTIYGSASRLIAMNQRDESVEREESVQSEEGRPYNIKASQNLEVLGGLVNIRRISGNATHATRMACVSSRCGLLHSLLVSSSDRVCMSCAAGNMTPTTILNIPQCPTPCRSIIKSL